MGVHMGHDGRLSPQMQERIWRSFQSGRELRHTAEASTLPYVVNRCEMEGVAYVLRGAPGVGYSIQRDHEAQEQVDAAMERRRTVSPRTGSFEG